MAGCGGCGGICGGESGAGELGSGGWAGADTISHEFPSGPMHSHASWPRAYRATCPVTLAPLALATPAQPESSDHDASYAKGASPPMPTV